MRLLPSLLVVRIGNGGASGNFQLSPILATLTPILFQSIDWQIFLITTLEGTDLHLEWVCLQSQLSMELVAVIIISAPWCIGTEPFMCLLQYNLQSAA